jgi:hypothetical protein
MFVLKTIFFQKGQIYKILPKVIFPTSNFPMPGSGMPNASTVHTTSNVICH